MSSADQRNSEGRKRHSLSSGLIGGDTGTQAPSAGGQGPYLSGEPAPWQPSEASLLEALATGSEGTSTAGSATTTKTGGHAAARAQHHPGMRDHRGRGALLCFPGH